MKEIILHNRIEEIERLGNFVDELSDELGIDPGTAFNLNLALEEAATNIINYAYPEGEDHTFSITARKDDKAVLSLSLRDSGTAFNPLEEAPEVDTTLGVEERAIGGLGIFLIRQIMDSVSYERTDGQNILTMTKQL